MTVFALGQIGDKRAVEPLIENLNDEDGEFIEMVIFALGEIGDNLALDAKNCNER